MFQIYFAFTMATTQYTIPELVKIGVQQGQIPQYLYKYRKLSDTTDLIFTESKLWFSKPSDFNDPFDCQLTVDTKNTEMEIAIFLQKNAPGMNPNEIKRLSKEYSKNQSQWYKMVTTIISNKVNSNGICCFAGSNDNILMWSHYTDSHKGICLKFDVLEDPDFFSIPLLVNYCTEYPYYNHLKDHTTLVKSLIQTKAKIWEYENELRVLKPSIGAYPYKKSALKDVCFGCNCSKSEINRIKSLVKANGFNVTFTKTAKASKKFELKIKNV